MANTETLTLRNVKASEISYQDALKLLRKKFPKAKVSKIEIDPETDQYTAHIVMAEFPPSKDEPKEESPDEAPEPDGGEDSEDPFAGGPPEEEGGEGDEGEIHKLVALVEMLCEKAGIDPMMMDQDPMGPGGDLPDVGAPSHMQPDPAAGGKPLPPPAPKPAPMGGGGASFASRRSVTVWREDDGVSQADFFKEANEFFPGYRVAKVERHMGQGGAYKGAVLVAALVAE